MKTTHRSKNDGVLRKASAELFRTPKATFMPLFIQYPKLVEGRVFDPSAGDGRFIENIIALGNKKSHGLYDIRESEYKAWKLKNLVLKLGEKNCTIGKNWLDTPTPKNLYNNIITNPPFSLAQQFVEKGLEWVVPGGNVTILHRLNWLGTGARSAWHRTMPLRYVIVITSRPRFELDGRPENKADVYEYAWFVYSKHNMAETKVRWLFP